MASTLYGIAKVRNTNKNAWCLQWNMVVAVSLCGGCMSACWCRGAAFHWWHHEFTMYCSILKRRLLPSLRALGRRALFQHDNDHKHTSKATVGFLKKNRVKWFSGKYVSWSEPNRTPYGEFLKRQVEHHSPSSIQSLKRSFLKNGKKIDWQNVANLVHSMPRRLGAVMKNHGGHSKY